MKSWPTGWSTYINGSFTVGYFIHLLTKDSTNYYWGTIDSDDLAGWTGSHFEGGRIKRGGLGTISRSVDIRKGGNIGILSDFDFTLLNQDGYFDTLETKKPCGGTIKIYRVLKDITPISLSVCDLRFYGLVSDINYNDNEIIFHCICDESEHKSIPRTQIDEKIFSSFTIPENSSGKPIPIQFGHIEKAEGYFCNAKTTVESFNLGTDEPAVVTDTSDDDNKLIDDTQSWSTNQWKDKDLEIIGGTGKGQLCAVNENNANQITIYDQFQTKPEAQGSVYQITDTQFDIVLSDNKIFGYLDENDAIVIQGYGSFQECWFWDNSANNYIPMNPRTMDFLNNFMPFTDMAGVRFKAGVVKKNEITFYYAYPFTDIANVGDVDYQNINNAIDWNNNTYAFCDEQIHHLGYEDTIYALLDCRFKTDLNDIIGSWDHLYAYAVAKHEMPYPLNNVGSWIGYYPLAVAQSPIEAWFWRNSGGPTFNNIPSDIYSQPTGFSFGANAKLESFPGGIGGLTAGDWATLNYNKKFIVKHYHGFSSSIVYKSYIYELGLIFTKTIELNENSKFYYHIKGRYVEDRGGWYGIPMGTLIEYAPDVIQGILRKDLDQSEASIYVLDFDQIRIFERNGWKLSYTIKERINSLDEIKKICEESLCIYYKDSNNKHRLKTLEIDREYVDTITQSDILTDDRKESSFEVTFSPIDDICNEIFIHYDKDPATGDYKKLAFVKKPDESSYDSSYVSTATSGSLLYGNEETYWDLINESYNNYGQIKTIDIHLDRVSDSATAENFLCKFIKWIYLRKAEIKFQTQLQHSNKELGDVLRLTSDHRTGDYFVYQIDEDLNDDIITIGMRQIGTYVAPVAGTTDLVTAKDRKRIVTAKGRKRIVLAKK